jgi:murein DD-endopeptidase MepM/ murein hydrolase activator NlpD
VQYTQSLQSQVYALVKKIKEVKERLQGQQNDLKTKLVTLEELREQLNESEDAAAAQRQARQGLLDRTRGVERNYQNLLSQSRNEESKIQDEINRLEEAAQAKGGKNIIPNSGVLAWPMEGKLTQGYGNTGFRSLGYSFHNGIDIAAPAGKPIYAAASGTVNGTGNNDDVAYGNWVTIKHTISTKNGDQQIVTLYAHLRSMKVKNGQEVAQGDLIGYQGNTGNTTRLLYGPERGYHLHFTVFDASGFKIVPGTYSKTYGPYSIPTGFTYNPLNFLAK